MMRTFRLAILCTFIVAGVVHGVPTGPETKKPSKRPAQLQRDGKLPRPADFKVALECDRPEYVLGENVLVHFRIENSGTKPFKIEHGGDYRGAPRHTRFIVTATPLDATINGGKDAPDPYPIIYHFGGLGGEQTLKPGEQLEQSLQLMHYVHIAAAGEYLIRVSHDFGWMPSVDGVGATAETRVRFAMPDDAMAKKVVEKMAALPARNSTFGKREADFADFSVLRYAIYLPMLGDRLNFDAGVDEHLRVGRECLSAIERMPDPAAIKTLLRLADDKDGAAASRIAMALTYHLPAAASDKAYGPPERFPADFSWRDQFADDVRKFATRLLEMESSANVASGAALIKQVGRPEDMTALIAAMDRVIPTMARTPYNDGIFSAPRNTMASLQMAVGDLISRGGELPAEPTTPGQIIACLATFQPDMAKAWEARIAEWSSHSVAYVRELSLNASPVPPPDALRAHLPALIEADDINVRMAASRLAQRAKEESCGAAILRRLKSATTTWELDQHAYAAADVGVQVEAWHVMVDRMGDEKIFFSLLQHLCDVTEHSGGFGWRNDAATLTVIKRVKARWREFLKDHDAELRAGKRFKPGDGQFTEELLPPEFTMSTAKGDWPPRKR